MPFFFFFNVIVLSATKGTVLLKSVHCCLRGFLQVTGPFLQALMWMWGQWQTDSHHLVDSNWHTAQLRGATWGKSASENWWNMVPPSLLRGSYSPSFHQSPSSCPTPTPSPLLLNSFSLKSPPAGVKSDCWAPHPRAPDSAGLGWDQKFAFLTRSQVKPELWVWGPHLEKCCPRRSH